MGKISKSIRLITPFLSPPLRRVRTGKPSNKRYCIHLPWSCVPVWSPSSHQGGYHATLPFPALRWGHGERNGDFTRDKNRIVVVP